MKYCDDYAERLGWEVTPGFYPQQCCSSCHEDVEYGYDLLEVSDTTGALEGLVCCAVSIALDEAADTLRQDT